MVLRYPSHPAGVTSGALLRVILIVGLAIALMLVLALVFDVGRAGPSYQSVPDPAGPLPF